MRAQSTRSWSMPIASKLRPPGVDRSSTPGRRRALAIRRAPLGPRRRVCHRRCDRATTQLLDDRPGRQNVFARFDAVGAGAQNVDPRLVSNRRHHGRKVQERADEHAPRLPRMIEGPRAVGRGEKHAPAADRLPACTPTANCRDRNPSIRLPVPLAAQHDVCPIASPPPPGPRRSPKTARPPSPPPPAPGKSSTSPAASRSPRPCSRPARLSAICRGKLWTRSSCM